MNVIEEAIATLGIPGSIAVVIVSIFALLQLIGEIIEASGKVAPTLLMIRKWIVKKHEERQAKDQLLRDVKTLLDEVNSHYNPEKIAQRDAWMAWVNERAVVYDNTIVEYRDAIDNVADALKQNTKMTEQMFVESSRDRIIDFASKVSNPVCYVSREEFNRIFKVYDKYEAFLAEHNMTNGEVEINYEIIRDAYVDFTENHKFVEDIRAQQRR